MKKRNGREGKEGGEDQGNENGGEGSNVVCTYSWPATLVGYQVHVPINSCIDLQNRRKGF